MTSSLQKEKNNKQKQKNFSDTERLFLSSKGLNRKQFMHYMDRQLQLWQAIFLKSPLALLQDFESQ